MDECRGMKAALAAYVVRLGALETALVTELFAFRAFGYRRPRGGRAPSARL